MSTQKICWLCDKYINDQDKINVESIADAEWLKNAIKNKIKKAKKIVPVANYDIYNESLVHCSCMDNIKRDLEKLCDDR